MSLYLQLSKFLGTDSDTLHEVYYQWGIPGEKEETKRKGGGL